jgi:hypothetical protein
MVMDRETLRPLLLNDERMGHPFRENLPIAIAKHAREEKDPDGAAMSKERWLGEDASLFLLSFLAFFTAFYTFIF